MQMLLKMNENAAKLTKVRTTTIFRVLGERVEYVHFIHIYKKDFRRVEAIAKFDAPLVKSL